MKASWEKTEKNKGILTVETDGAIGSRRTGSSV